MMVLPVRSAKNAAHSKLEELMELDANGTDENDEEGYEEESSGNESQYGGNYNGS